MSQPIVKSLLSLAFVWWVANSLAQQPAANPYLAPYGAPVSVETAKKAAAAALAETRKNNWDKRQPRLLREDR